MFAMKSDKLGNLTDKKQNVLLRAIVGKTPGDGDSIKRQEKGFYFYGQKREGGRKSDVI